MIIARIAGSHEIPSGIIHENEILAKNLLNIYEFMNWRPVKAALTRFLFV